ncbi:MAG TPA: hypothetical protein VGL11_00875 [Candidatus Binatia bacterium]|jgi:hypothetical protein
MNWETRSRKGMWLAARVVTALLATAAAASAQVDKVTADATGIT